MKIFKSRTDAEYLRLLHERLKLDGPQGLKATAIPVSPPRIITDPTTKTSREYNRCVRIDFMGIAATTLFDAGQMFARDHMHEEIVALMSAAEDLNAAGCFIRFRLLFLYPYSISAYSRIQADWSENRGSMKEPRYTRNFDIVEQVDYDIFTMSSLIRTQYGMLGRVQHLVEDFYGKAGWGDGSPNSIVVRFTPVDPMMCCLFVNDVLFYDAYLLSKEMRMQKECTTKYAPTVQLGRDDGDAFLAFEDHFRYLWELDVTLDCDDATNFGSSKEPSLAKIKPPSHISYDGKARRIWISKPDLSEEKSHSWRYCARSVFNKYCADLAPSPASELLFLACSWVPNGNGVSTPHPDAQDLAGMLQEDLQNKGLMSVRIMEATTKGFLMQQLYASLDDSTLGLVMASKDIEIKSGEFVSKPNVYHELGYLMNKHGLGRILLLFEKDVIIPSNVGDIVRKQFRTGKMSVLYPEIIQSIIEICTFNPQIIRTIWGNHEARLDKLVVEGRIKINEANVTKKRLKEIAKNMGINI